jgi:hypothetical protein
MYNIFTVNVCVRFKYQEKPMNEASRRTFHRLGWLTRPRPAVRVRYIISVCKAITLITAVWLHYGDAVFYVVRAS